MALGGITYISSSGIVSQVVRDLRWRRNPETGPVVSILVIEDLVMAPYLPILTVILTGTGLVAGLISVGVALLVVAVVLVVAVRRSDWSPRFFQASEPVGLLLVVFGLAVAAAGVAGLLSFSSAVAAFLVGLLLTGEVAEVARRRLDPLRELLAAVFFAYFGLVTDPRELPGVLLPAVALVIVTVLTKFLTGWYASGTVGGGAISTAAGRCPALRPRRVQRHHRRAGRGQWRAACAVLGPGRRLRAPHRHPRAPAGQVRRARGLVVGAAPRASREVTVVRSML